MIGLAAAESQKEEEDFKLNLFPEQVFSNEGVGSGAVYKDRNVINIDLGKNQAKQEVKKVMKEFEDFKAEAAGGHTGDDLLDLMDSL